MRIMVETIAFGMGIDKEDIRHVICCGVPKNLCGWVQELRHAGWDGKQSTATIIYSACNIEHCNRVLKEISNMSCHMSKALAAE